MIQTRKVSISPQSWTVTLAFRANIAWLLKWNYFPTFKSIAFFPSTHIHWRHQQIYFLSKWWFWFYFISFIFNSRFRGGIHALLKTDFWFLGYLRGCPRPRSPPGTGAGLGAGTISRWGEPLCPDPQTGASGVSTGYWEQTAERQLSDQRHS